MKPLPTDGLPELLLPAGSPGKLEMALAYGADAVYLGAAGLSMRPDTASFDVPMLERAVERVHAAGKRLYAAANSLLLQAELAAFESWLSETSQVELDGLIVSDLGALAIAREQRPELPIHISTQLSVANRRAATLLAELGVKRVILARECTLQDARTIAESCRPLEVEIFVHGAMCVAISGRCLLSAHLSGNSANRGECKHSCRWEWQLVEKKRPGEALPIFETGRETILLGSKDLCLIAHLPEVIATNVASLKVEGRMKSEYYVATIARAYRAALDDCAAGRPCDPRWMSELEAVSHRPFSTGFAFGYRSTLAAELQTHNHPISSCQLVGYVDRIDQANRLTVRVKNPFGPGDTLEWIGPHRRQGTLAVSHIWDSDRIVLERAISATVVHVEARLSGDPLVPNAILRRRL